MNPITITTGDVTTIQEAQYVLNKVLDIVNLVSCFCHEDMDKNESIFELWLQCSAVFSKAYDAREIAEEIIAEVAITAQA